MYSIRTATLEESCLYCLVDGQGAIVKKYYEEIDDFSKELQKYNQPPTNEERLAATEAAILALMGV